MQILAKCSVFDDRRQTFTLQFELDLHPQERLSRGTKIHIKKTLRTTKKGLQ